MSYRTFKRVLGETNLERKCRWWFGISLFVMLALSFTWYQRQTDRLVEDTIETRGEESVRAGWQKLHLETLAKTAEVAKTVELGNAEGQRQDEQDKQDADFYSYIAESSQNLGRKFKWEAILPPSRSEVPARSACATTSKQIFWPSGRHHILKRPRAEDSDSTSPDLLPHVNRRKEVDGLQVYQYYQPMPARHACVICHNAIRRATTFE